MIPPPQPSNRLRTTRALSAEWEQGAAFTGCGGSIPVAGHFQDSIGVSPMLIGFAKDNDQIHSPNEKYDLQSFHKGIRSWARIIEALSVDTRSRQMAKKYWWMALSTRPAS